MEFLMSSGKAPWRADCSSRLLLGLRGVCACSGLHRPSLPWCVKNHLSEAEIALPGANWSWQPAWLKGGCGVAKQKLGYKEKIRHEASIDAPL